MIDAKELIKQAGLTPRQVRFLVAYYFDGFFEREIAEVEGCSRPTVSVVLTKAKQKLEEAGYPVPIRLPRPKESYFANDKLNLLSKREAGYYQWVSDDRH